MAPDRGISDATGVMLIAALTVSLALGVGIGVVEYQRAQAPPETNAAFGVVLDGANVTIIHRAGDAVARSALTVVARGSEVVRFRGARAVEVRGDGDALFEPGEKWRWRHDTGFPRDTVVLTLSATREEGTASVIDTAKIVEWQPGVAMPPTEDDGAERPRAAVTVSNTNPPTGERVTFDATDSRDADGEIVATEWDLDGDGSFERTGSVVTRTYADDGERTITLRVTDDDGATDTVTTVVTVRNRAPVTDFEVTCTEYTCTFTADSSDPDGDIVATDWRFGDGASGSGRSVTHEYATGGTYDVTLTVTDDDGAEVSTTQSVGVEGDIEFVAADAVAPDGRGTKTAVRVTLENRRGHEVTVVATSVSVSKRNVEVVMERSWGTGPFHSEFHWDATDDGWVETGYFDAYETGTVVELTDDARVASGDRVTVTIAAFGEQRSRCWWWFCWPEFKPRNVQGSSVTLEVWLVYGTHLTYEFRV